MKSFVRAILFCFAAFCMAKAISTANGQSINVTINGQPVDPARVSITIDVATDPVVDPDPVPDSDTDPIPDIEPAPTAESPTGRNPRLMWTAQQQGIWARMRAERHPEWILFEKEISKSNARTEFFAVAYQITADPAYAQTVYKHVANPGAQNSMWVGRDFNAAPKPTGSFQDAIRERLVDWCIWYEWCYPALTVDQRVTWERTIRDVAEWILTENGLRTNDSDFTSTAYMGLACADVVLGTDYLARSTSKNTPVKIGGWHYTPGDDMSARDVIHRFFTFAGGGNYVESTHYNWNTVWLLLNAREAIRRGTGQDYFPEIASFADDAPLYEAMSTTPDQRDIWMWGDMESPHSRYMHRRPQYFQILKADSLIDSTRAALGDAEWYSGFSFWGRTWYTIDPYRTGANGQPNANPTLPTSHLASGTNVYLARSPEANALFAAHFPGNSGEDHLPSCYGDFALYLGGEWAVDRIRGYGLSATAHNNSLICGFPVFHERGAGASDGVQTWEGPDWHAVRSSTRGMPTASWNNWQRPAKAFVRDKTRTIIWLEPSTIVIHETVDMDDPKLYGDYATRYVRDKPTIDGSGWLYDCITHCETKPTVDAANGIVKWTTARGTPVVMRELTGNVEECKAVDENEKTSGKFRHGFGYVPDAERKWHVRHRSNKAGKSEFLYVISVGGEVEAKLVSGGVMVDGRLVEINSGVYVRD